MTREQKIDAAVRGVLSVDQWHNVLLDVDMIGGNREMSFLACYPSLVSRVRQEYRRLWL